MHFGFALELPNIYLWNIDLLGTHLDLLDTDILSKWFFLSPKCLQELFKACLQDFFKTCPQDVLKTSSA